MARRGASGASKAESGSVNIRPGVRVLSVLKHLNYKPWFALAEFVDNAIQSHLNSTDELKAIDGKKSKLVVKIMIDADDPGMITIRDNAGGIHSTDYQRAFRAAEVPEDSTGLSEFGMGMKSAACWFAPMWSVRTKALGESEEKTVSFDIRRILRNSEEELVVSRRKVNPNQHYTEIILRGLYNKAPKGRTLGKIREHLASIYRVFSSEGLLELYLNGDQIRYVAPLILEAPFYKTPTGKAIEWRKDVAFDLGGGRGVNGFAALRQKASTSEAGFALFRRKRLIQGSADEGYRPEAIFGQSNTYAYQRLFGELHLSGFDVSHTKDGFRWGEGEELFLKKLREHIADTPIPLLDQAQGYRVNPAKAIAKRDAKALVERTAEAIADESPPVLDKLGSREPAATPLRPLASRQSVAGKVFEISHQGERWEIALELASDPAMGSWVELGEKAPADSGRGRSGVRRLQIRFGLDHPFTQAFVGARQEGLESQMRIAAGLALAEVLAREGGVRQAGTIRHNLNALLRDALSNP